MVHQVVINVLSDQSTRTITIEEAAKEAPKEEKRNPQAACKKEEAPKEKAVPNNRQNRFAPSARKETSCEAKQPTVVPNIRMVVHSGWIMRLMGKGYRMRELISVINQIQKE